MGDEGRGESRRKRKGALAVRLDRSPVSSLTSPGVPPPLSPEAEIEREQWRREVQHRREELKKIRLRIAVWGPSDLSTSGGKLRWRVYKWLADANHLPEFPEVTCVASKGALSVQGLLQADTADLIIAIACSPGAITEAVDASARPAIAGKLLVLLDEEHREGFAFKTLMENQTTGNYRVIVYSGLSAAACGVLKSSIITHAEHVRSKKYLRRRGLEHDGGRP